jgi:MFS family permease
MAEPSTNPYSPPAEPAAAEERPAFSTRPLIPIFIIVFIDVMGLTLIIPLLPFYALRFGATPLIATTLLSVFAFFQIISGPILGQWSDRAGRKPVLLTSQLGMLASYVVLWQARALWMVFLGRIIAGITSGNLSVAQAYISDVTKPEERTKAFAFFGIAFGLGFILGPALAFGMQKLGDDATPFLGSAVLSGLSFLSTLFMLPKAKPVGQSGRSSPAWELLQRPEARRRLTEFLLFNLSFSTFIGGFALYLRAKFNFDSSKASLMFVYSGFIGVLFQGAIGPLVRKLGEVRLSLIGFITLGLGNAFIGWLPSWKLLLVFAFLGGFGGAVVRPCLTTLITKSVGRHEQGKALGLGTTLASISQLVGPPLAGFLIDKNQLGAYGLASGVLAFIGALLVARPELAPAVIPQAGGDGTA